MSDFYSEALNAYEEGGDYISILKKHHKSELHRYKETEVVSKVEILSAGLNISCDACNELDGRQFTIKEALETMPLPNLKCTYSWSSLEPGFCRCTYVPIVE